MQHLILLVIYGRFDSTWLSSYLNLNRVHEIEDTM